MNKTECLALLDKIEAEIDNHQWEAQVDECMSLLDHNDLKPYMKDFNLPEVEMDRSLPATWMEDVDPESVEYMEVVEKYEDVYFFLRSEASREMEALNMIDAQDERDQLRQYWSDVGVR
jgi:hypothetical protein